MIRPNSSQEPVSPTDKMNSKVPMKSSLLNRDMFQRGAFRLDKFLPKETFGASSAQANPSEVPKTAAWLLDRALDEVTSDESSSPLFKGQKRSLDQVNLLEVNLACDDSSSFPSIEWPSSDDDDETDALGACFATSTEQSVDLFPPKAKRRCQGLLRSKQISRELCFLGDVA